MLKDYVLLFMDLVVLIKDLFIFEITEEPTIKNSNHPNYSKNLNEVNTIKIAVPVLKEVVMAVEPLLV